MPISSRKRLGPGRQPVRHKRLWQTGLLALAFLLSGTVLANSAHGLLAKADAAHWISEGHGPRVVYVIFDPNCPYCHLLYNESQAHLRHYQFRWIPVGLLAHSSAGKAAAILASGNPAQALRTNENGYRTKRGERGGAIVPLQNIPANIIRELQDNLAVLDDTGIKVVPKMIFAGPDDKPRTVTGALDARDLGQVLHGVAPLARARRIVDTAHPCRHPVTALTTPDS